MAENNENIRRSTRIKSRINYSDSEDDIRTPRSRARGNYSLVYYEMNFIVCAGVCGCANITLLLIMHFFES